MADAARTAAATARLSHRRSAAGTVATTNDTRATGVVASADMALRTRRARRWRPPCWPAAARAPPTRPAARARPSSCGSPTATTRTSRTPARSSTSPRRSRSAPAATLRVRITYVAAGTATPYVEERTIAAVRGGRFDLGWIGARAWDEVGVKSFRALQAPFLITSNPLLDRVVDEPAGRRDARLARDARTSSGSRSCRTTCAIRPAWGGRSSRPPTSSARGSGSSRPG